MACATWAGFISPTTAACHLYTRCIIKVHRKQQPDIQRAIKVKILCRFDWSYFVLIISQPTTQATPNPHHPLIIPVLLLLVSLNNCLWPLIWKCGPRDCAGFNFNPLSIFTPFTAIIQRNGGMMDERAQ